MARETELGFKIKRVLSDNDQWKKIVKETEAFYDRVNSNPVELDIGDIKHVVVQLQQVRSEYNKINNDTSSNHGQIEFANTLCDVLDKAEDKFGNIGVMFKNVNDNTRKYVTGLSDITNHLADSSFGVAFVDIGAQFGELQKKATELFSTLKSLDTIHFGMFNLDSTSMDVEQLRYCLNVLSDMQDVAEKMMDIDPNMREKDFVGQLAPRDLSRAISQAENDLDDLRRLRLDTTEELRKRREIIYEIEEGYTWEDYEHENAKKNVHNDEIYTDAIENIQRYIDKRREAINELKRHEYDLFSADGIYEYENRANAEIERLQSLMKELQDLRNGNKNGDPIPINFSEVVTALNEIKQVIREIKDAFEPLTQAFANEDSAISKMVNSNVEDLNRLQEKFEQVFRDIKTLSEKDFASQTTNVVQQTINAPGGVLKAQRTELKELTKMLAQYQSAITRLNSQSHVFKQIGLSGKDQMDFYMFDPNEILGGLGKANTAGKMDAFADLLDDYKATIVQLAKEINKVMSGAVDLNPLQNLKKQDPNIINLDQTTSNVDGILNEVKSIRDKIDAEIQSIRTSFASIFKFDSLNPNFDNITSITDRIYQQFAELQNKIKALDFKIETPNIEGVSEAIKVIKQEGEAAEGATPKKNDFTIANEKLAVGMKETGSAGKIAVDGVTAESRAVEDAAKRVAQSVKQIRADQNTIVSEYKNLYGGKGKVNANLASMFNKVIDNANMDVSAIKTSFGTKSYKDADKNIIEYDYIKLIAEGTDALGKATTVTREYEVATGGLIKKLGTFKDVKDTFNISQEVEMANSKVAELEKRMGSFRINLDGVRRAASNITDEASLDVFEKELDGANQKLKELKATLKSTHSLDPVTNAEGMMANLQKTVETYRESIKKFSNVDGAVDLGTSLGTLEKKISKYNDADDGMAKAKIVQEVNKEIASFNTQLDLVKAKYAEENRMLREQQQEYNRLINLQSKLYTDKTKLAKAEYGSADEQILQGRVQARQEEYEETLKAIAGTDNYNAVKKKEIQLNEELAAVVNERIKKEENLAWAQKEQENSLRIQQETDAAYRERAEAIKAEAAAEKELAVAKKESDAFYQQEEKTRKAQEDAAWAEYRAEQSAAAEKERQINLAFSQKAAKEAADAERELAQARKEADAYFTAVEKQEQKEEEAKKARELNALYRERNTIITAIIKYNNKAETLKTDKAIQRAKEQLALETQRLAAIDEEINKYGELINLSKLEQQNDRLTSRLRDSNVTNAIANEQKQDVKEVNNLLERRKEIHDKILKLQKQLNSASGDTEKKAIQQQIDVQNTLFRFYSNLLRGNTDQYAARRFKEQEDEFLAQKSWVNAQSAIRAAAVTDKSELEEQKQHYRDILNLVNELFETQKELHKINTDPTDTVHTADREKEIARVKELSMLLKEIYGIDIKNLTGSLDKNSLLTQEQKNKLLEEERDYKKEIADITSASADKEANLARIEAERMQKKVDAEKQNYGKSDFGKLEKFYNSMNASVRELQSGGHISATLTNLVSEFEVAYNRVEALRKQFNENPASVTPDLKNQFHDSVRQADALRERISSIFKESKNLSKIGNLLTIGKEDVSNVDNLRTAMIHFANDAFDGQATITGFNEKGTEMYATLNKGAGAVENITVAMDKSTGTLKAFVTGTSRASNELLRLKNEALNGAKHLARMYFSFYDIIRYVRSGINHVKEIDLAMTELKKVTDETDASYKEFLKDASSTSAVIGSTISDFTEATATFARLGYSMEESANMAETAIIYKNVADGLDSVEESSESIISTMMAFGIEANDTMSIIDRFNAVGKYIAQVI